MEMLVTNIDKCEYFTATNAWPAHLALLQGVLPPTATLTDDLVGSWRGNSIEIVKAGRQDQSAAIEEISALYALQATGNNWQTIYRKITLDFTNFGPKLGKLIASDPEMCDFCFRQMTGPWDYSWLTIDTTQDLLNRVGKRLGKPYQRKYKEWLAAQRSVPAEVRTVLKESGYYTDLRRVQEWIKKPCQTEVVA